MKVEILINAIGSMGDQCQPMLLLWSFVSLFQLFLLVDIHEVWSDLYEN